MKWATIHKCCQRIAVITAHHSLRIALGNHQPQYGATGQPHQKLTSSDFHQASYSSPLDFRLRHLLIMRLSKSLLLFLSASGLSLSSAFYIPGECWNPFQVFSVPRTRCCPRIITDVCNLLQVGRSARIKTMIRYHCLRTSSVRQRRNYHTRTRNCHSSARPVRTGLGRSLDHREPLH